MHIYFLLVSGSQTYWNEVVFQKTETETMHLKYIYRQLVLYIMKIEALFYHTF